MDVAKQLFPPSPGHHDAQQRKKLRGHTNGNQSGSYRLGCRGAVFSLLLCLMAIFCTALLNGEWMDGRKEDLQDFFGDRPLKMSKTDSLKGRYILGCLGALHLAAIVGLLTGIGTFLFMYYDSAVPGNFPPTPVTPPSVSRFHPDTSRWHLGYIMVPVNTIVVFSLSLCYFRLYFGLPFS